MPSIIDITHHITTTSISWSSGEALLYMHSHIVRMHTTTKLNATIYRINYIEVDSEEQETRSRRLVEEQQEHR
jgi:hypothetical protein